MLLKSEVLWIQKNVVCTVSYFHMIDGKSQLRDFTRRLLGYLWFLGYLKLEWAPLPLNNVSTLRLDLNLSFLIKLKVRFP